jgi:formyltetrahydrofolate-dependent phosphoribosylglycinamide formyltransferase
LHLAVLLSGNGTTLQNLIDHIEAGKLAAEIVVVISSNPEAFGLVRARRHGLESSCLPWRAYDDARAYNDEVTRILDRYRPDLIALAGFMHKFCVAPHYRGRVINIHPSLIPAFCGQGYYGLRVHRAALAYGVKVSGCTVHFVDEEYDHGPIILQRVVPVLDDDTPEDLAQRVAVEERKAYPEAIQLFAEGRLQVQDRWVTVLGSKPARIIPPQGDQGKGA